ncbi:MAG: thymidine kinase, partial [Anaerolineae bacterium]|nr:thymidine kinase [Anaerolineae bacterium]
MIHHSGRVEVICGSMFCSKTEELIRLIRRATIARQRVQVFKHRLDDRYEGVTKLSSHDGQHIAAQHISHSRELLPLLAEDTT